MNVFFDVLGTLLTTDGLPRPHAREAFLRLREAGHEVYLWSSAGGAYAAGAAEVLGVADLAAEGVRGLSPEVIAALPGRGGGLRRVHTG